MHGINQGRPISGKPRDGPSFNDMKFAKKMYKNNLNKLKCDSKDNITDELFQKLLNTKRYQFWKTWQSKFDKNASPSSSIDGVRDVQAIANVFADKFAANCSPNNPRKTHEAQLRVTDTMKK